MKNIDDQFEYAQILVLTKPLKKKKKKPTTLHITIKSEGDMK